MSAVLRSFLLSTLLLAVACASPAEEHCRKAEECNQLAGKTYDQCVADQASCGVRLREVGGECSRIADARDDVLSCLASLSCERRGSLSAIEDDACGPYLRKQVEVAIEVAQSGATCPVCL